MDPLSELLTLVAAVLVVGSLGGVTLYLWWAASMDAQRQPDTVPSAPQRVQGPVHITRIVPPRAVMPSAFIPETVTCPDCGKEGCTPGPDGLPLAHTVGRGRGAELCGCGRTR